MSAPPQVYIASPLGFAASSDSYRAVISAHVRDAGLKVLDPWHDPGEKHAKALAAAEKLPRAGDRRHALARLDEKAGRKNRGQLQRAHAVLAVLDGVDVDSGTAAEVGFAAAQGTPVVGLRTDLRQTGENDGCVVNLQVTYFIHLHGGEIFTTLPAAVTLLQKLAMRRSRRKP